MSRQTIAMVLLALCICLAFAEPQSTKTQSAITGTITDPGGAVIADARALVHWDSFGGGGWKNIGISHDVTVVTDREGRYLVVVPPGFYDVFITARGFTPVAAKVWVKQGEQTTFSAHLGLDGRETSELGDMH
jgi:hypothetical protein